MVGGWGGDIRMLKGTKGIKAGFSLGDPGLASLVVSLPNAFLPFRVQGWGLHVKREG